MTPMAKNYQPLGQNRWAMSLRGIVALILSLIAFFIPRVTRNDLALWFGLYALFSGIICLWLGIDADTRLRDTGNNWWAALAYRPGHQPLVREGITGLLAAVAITVTSKTGLATGLVVLILIAAWALLTGLQEIEVAKQLHPFHARDLAGNWRPGGGASVWLHRAGLASILFGVLTPLFCVPVLLARNGTDAFMGFAWLIGAYTLLFGIFMLRVASGLRHKYYFP